MKTKCLKALGSFKVLTNTDWGEGGGADRKTLLCLCRALVRPKLNYGCIVHGTAYKKEFSIETGPYPSPRFANCFWNLSHFTCKRSLCESTRDDIEKQTRKNQKQTEIKQQQQKQQQQQQTNKTTTTTKLSMNYVLKPKTCPNNPAYSCVFEPPNSNSLKNPN